MNDNSAARSDEQDATDTSDASDAVDATVATDRADGPETARHGDADDEPAVDLDRDQVFDALRNRRRRDVIEYLVGRDGGATVGELADHVAAIENDTTVEAVSSDQRKRAYVALYQSHLPKLDGMGVVEYDSDRGNVALGPNSTRLYPYMSGVAVDGDSRPWEYVYLGYGVVCLAVLSAAVGLGVATGGEVLLVAFAAVACLCALALGHAVDHRRRVPR